MRTILALLLLTIAMRSSTIPMAAQDPVLQLSPDERTIGDAMLGAGVVGDALPSAPIGEPTLYFPLEERTRSYRVTSGAHAGDTYLLKVGRHARPTGAQAWRFQLSPTQAAYLHRADDGALVMPAVSDSDHGILVVTTPPNPFIVEGMQPGETRSFTQTVAVDYLDDPSRLDYSGTMAGTLQYVGTYRVTVPAGTFDAVLLRTKCEGKVGPAHTSDTAYYFFAPGTGVVAMIGQEDVEAFWVIHLDTKSGKVLAAS
jgi:hypothetical protein